jgi:hypothetical protein
MLEIVDLRPGGLAESQQFCLDLAETFGIKKSSAPIPKPLSPEELSAINTIIGQRLNLF